MRLYQMSRNPLKMLNSYHQVTIVSYNNYIEFAHMLSIISGFQRLVKNSTELVDESLEGLLEEGDVITVLFDVTGGMRAKWRKKRMRRLRRKRRKMRMRAR